MRNRVKKGQLVFFKADKSGKLMATNKENYLMLGIIGIGTHRKTDRNEAKRIEKRINETPAFG